jgi:signal transduction histidine kinase
LLDEAVLGALAHAGDEVVVHREYAPDVPPVPVDARLLRQAFLNLTVNAIQAMPDGGDLTVSIQRQGDSAVVEIRDTGTGIPERAHARLFQPFFTTKATGTGLGLALVKRIVDDHAGSIEARSGKPHGTVFAIRLPLARVVAGSRGTIRGRTGGGPAS